MSCSWVQASSPMNILETKRLILRWLRVEDAEFVLELLNDVSFLRNIGDKGVRTLDDARSYILNSAVASYERLGFGLYLVELKDSGIPVGICGLVKRESLQDVDIGFAFLPRFWSRGYATESGQAVKSYAIDVVGLNRVAAVTNPDNDGSIRVLERIGLKYERMVKLEKDAQEIKLYAYDASRSRSQEGCG